MIRVSQQLFQSVASTNYRCLTIRVQSMPSEDVARMRIDARGDYPRSTPIQDLINTIPGNCMYMCYRKASAVDPICIYTLHAVPSTYPNLHRTILRFSESQPANTILKQGEISDTRNYMYLCLEAIHIYIIINVLHIQGTHKRYAADKQ